MGEPVSGVRNEKERASGAPSGVAADSLLLSENHEAIPCIERAPRDVDKRWWEFRSLVEVGRDERTCQRE